jgi:predicted NBD/HSP70 family sugar kinase
MKNQDSKFVTTAAIITRRLRKGKIYDDFRKVWYHTTGFGLTGREDGGSNTMFTLINMFDPDEIVVLGFARTTLESLKDALNIEVAFRGENPMDDVIEPEMGRGFYALISEDDFSAAGDVPYKPPSIAGEETNLEEFYENLQALRKLFADAAMRRDEINEARKRGADKKK